MITPKFSNGRIDSLENLYSSVRDCAIENLQEAMRCVIKRTGVVMSGDAFAAYIENGKLIIPIGSIVFGNYEIYSPFKPTTIELDIPTMNADKYLIASLKYVSSLPYPAFPDPESEVSNVIIDSVSTPTLELSLQDVWAPPSDSDVLIGILNYNSGNISYCDERRTNSLALIDPSDIATNFPIASIETPHVYRLPDSTSIPLSANYDLKHGATFVRIQWSIPRGMSDIQYFSAEMVPINEFGEHPTGTVSAQYIPKLEEINTLGPSPIAFINMRCVPGIKYKVYLYGYFSRLALAKRLLGTVEFDTAGDNTAPGALDVTITDLVPSGESIQIDTDYVGPGKMQVFIKDASFVPSVISKAFLHYEGTVMPIVYSANTDVVILIRIVDQNERVTSNSGELSHELVTTGELSDQEEQLVFAVPCIVDPTIPVDSVEISSFTAPYSFQITKGIFYQLWDKDFDPILEDPGEIRIEANSALVDSFTYAVDGDGMLGSTVFSSPSTIEEGLIVDISAEKTAGQITPYYGVVVLYVKKVIT